MSHFNDLPGARTVPTTWLRLAERNIAAVVEMRAMTLVTGVPGSGKTHGIDAICGRLRGYRTVCVEAPPSATPKQLANVLLSEATRVPHNESRFIGTDLLLATLADRPSIIVVDEAQRLSLLNLEWLRYVHFHVPGRAPLVIVGGPLAQKRLQRDHQLWSRIVMPSAFGQLDTATIAATIRGFHDVWKGVPTRVLQRYNAKLHGVFRDWNRLTRQVLLLSQEPGASQLSIEKLVELAFVREFAVGGAA